MIPDVVKLSWLACLSEVYCHYIVDLRGGVYLMGRVIFHSRPTRGHSFWACTAFIGFCKIGQSLIPTALFHHGVCDLIHFVRLATYG